MDEIQMGSVPATLVTPENIEDGRVMLYIHGGGYVAGNPAGYHGIAGNYAKLLFPIQIRPQHKRWIKARPRYLSRIVWLLKKTVPRSGC
ncbi:hypothetical protein D3C84_850520 [compost metagenome]